MHASRNKEGGVGRATSSTCVHNLVPKGLRWIRLWFERPPSEYKAHQVARSLLDLHFTRHHIRANELREVNMVNQLGFARCLFPGNKQVLRKDALGDQPKLLLFRCAGNTDDVLVTPKKGDCGDDVRGRSRKMRGIVRNYLEAGGSIGGASMRHVPSRSHDLH